MKKNSIFVCSFVVLILLSCISAAENSLNSRNTLRARKNPVKFYTKYTFRGNVAIKVENVSSDRKFNCTYFYKNRKLVKIEKDSNGDGIIDWRETFNFDRTQQYSVQETDSGFKFVPTVWLYFMPMFDGHYYTATTTQKLINNKWTDTFENYSKIYRGPGPADGPVYHIIKSKYVKGKLIKWERMIEGLSRKPHYILVEHKGEDTYKKSTGKSKDKISKIEIYKNSELVKSMFDTDWDGVIDRQYEYFPKIKGKIKEQKLVDGKWLDTFEEESHQKQIWLGNYRNMIRKRVCSKGFLVRGEFLDKVTRKLIYRNVYEYKDKVFFTMETDCDKDGKIDLKLTFKAGHPGHPPIRGQALRDGKWVKDFSHEEPGRNYVFKKGTLDYYEIKYDEDKDGKIDLIFRIESSNNYAISDAKALRNGKWVKDFVSNINGKETFRNGKRIRQESGIDDDRDGNIDYITEFGEKGEIRTGKNGKIDTWTYWVRPAQGKPFRIEKRDTDGDGKPDIIINYSDFTINKIKK